MDRPDPVKTNMAICSTRFISDWVWWFFLFWIPDYLNKAHGVDMKQAVLPIILIYSVSSMAELAAAGSPPGLLLPGNPSILPGKEAS
jgi:hypothetical protein